MKWQNVMVVVVLGFKDTVEAIGILVIVYVLMATGCALKTAEECSVMKVTKDKVAIVSVQCPICLLDVQLHIQTLTPVLGMTLECLTLVLPFLVFFQKDFSVTITTEICVLKVLLNSHVFNVIALLHKHAGVDKTVKTVVAIDDLQVLAVWVIMQWVVVLLGVVTLVAAAQYTYAGVAYNMSINKQNKQILNSLRGI